jgi:catechol 2,3-dioxygenase-like lactoylglutathione lyase family enzyme
MGAPGIAHPCKSRISRQPRAARRCTNRTSGPARACAIDSGSLDPVSAGSPEGLRKQVRVGSIVVRCRRFDEMLAFWQAALGYVPKYPPEDGWVILTDPTGRAPNISLDYIEQPPPLGKISRVHLDLYTDDGPGEVERLLALGATRYEREAGPDDDFVVLVDPDGNRFCVVD